MLKLALLSNVLINVTDCAAAEAELAPLPPSAEPPLDWSLKTGARLLSAAPFACFEAMGLAAGGARGAALRRFAEGSVNGGNLQVLHSAEVVNW